MKVLLVLPSISIIKTLKSSIRDVIVILSQLIDNLLLKYYNIDKMYIYPSYRKIRRIIDVVIPKTIPKEFILEEKDIYDIDSNLNYIIYPKGKILLSKTLNEILYNLWKKKKKVFIVSSIVKEGIEYYLIEKVENIIDINANYKLVVTEYNTLHGLNYNIYICSIERNKTIIVLMHDEILLTVLE